MVMGRDSCSEGRGFESWHCILDGHHIFSYVCCKNCNCLFEKDENKNEKEAEFGPFLEKKKE